MILLAGTTVSAHAQAADAEAAMGDSDRAAQPTEAELLEDFNYYVMIANVEMAVANANALLARGLKPEQFVGLIEEEPLMGERFDNAYRRALLIPGLEDAAAKLNKLYEDGRRARARDPEEIARNIQLLIGTKRGQILARERLASAGEYAVPQLLSVITARQNPALVGEVARLLADMGKQAVVPLCTALPSIDEVSQETVCRILSQIPYPISAAYLQDLATTTTNDRVREAATAAITTLTGSYDAGFSAAASYRSVAEEYAAESPSVTSFPGEEHQLLWSFIPEIGLNPTAVRTEVFHEARVMELCERALRLDGTDQEAIALWLAANFSREIDTPEGYENPAYGEGRRDATYYAVAAGAGPVQRVLARALDRRDTPLARRAIAALAQSAGAESITGEGSSLNLALTYPDRRVQVEAAMAMAMAAPSSDFAGSDRVVPIIAAAVKDAGVRYGLVIASDAEQQQRVTSVLEAQGYTVLPPARTLADAEQSIASVPGVDIVTVHLSTESTLSAIEEARASARLLATPMLAILSPAAATEHQFRYQSDPLTRIAREGITDEEMSSAVNALVVSATGSAMTDEESAGYASQAIALLRDLAMTRSGVLRVEDSSEALLTAMQQGDSERRLAIADILAHVGQQRVQVGLMDEAMAVEGEQRVALLQRLTQSARRFGNMLEERQIGRLLEMTSSPEDAEATAAAALTGALSLPNDRLVPVITGGE